MGQRVSAETLVHATPEQVYDVIVDLPAYPQWASDVTRTEVIETTDDGLPLLVAFDIDIRIALVHYTIRYTHERPDRISWTLEEGELLSELDGTYAMRRTDEGTVVAYELEAAVALPLPSFLQRRIAKVVLETGLSGLKQRVEELAADGGAA